MKVILLMCITFVISTPTLYHHSLYDASDKVTVFDKSNITLNVYNSSHPWLVEFYASWCGHCQQFAPSWKEFAKDVLQWQDLVRLAVIDCGDDVNTEICRDFGITGYPTVKYFPENATQGQEYEIFLTVDRSLREILVDVIHKELEEGRGREIYPDIRPLSLVNVSKLQDNLRRNDDFTFLYVTNDSASTVAAEVALDLHRTNVAILNIVVTTEELLTGFDIKQLPVALIYAGVNLTFKGLVKQNVTSRESFRQFIELFLKEEHVKVITRNYEYNFNERTTMQPEMYLIKEMKFVNFIEKMGDVHFQLDLEAAIRFSLQNDVAKLEKINGEKLEALRSYVKVLQKYAPLGIEKNILFERLDTALEKEEVAGKEINNILTTAEQSLKVFSSKELHYVGCRDSSTSIRDYPCSLWTLFHYLSVNSNNTDVKPNEVLSAVHGFVHHFFGCASCSEHFEKMAMEKHISNVEGREDAILWLWRAHNEVNLRLNGEGGQKIQFPSSERCPQCKKGDGRWIESEVLNYLKLMYSKYSTRLLGSDSYALFDFLDIL